MALNYNKVIIAGNLTRDPEVRFLANERAVCNLGLAVNRKYKGGDGEMREETTFVDVEAWGRTAELCGQYLTKGRGALIEGRLKLDTWETDAGEKRSKLKVLADSVQFLGGGDRSGGDAPSQPAAQPSAPPAADACDDSEPPF